MDFVAGYYFFVNGDEEGRRSLFVGCRDNLREGSFLNRKPNASSGCTVLNYFLWGNFSGISELRLGKLIESGLAVGRHLSASSQGESGGA